MRFEVEYTNEFESWWAELDVAEQQAVSASVTLLEQLGPRLPFPHSSSVESSRHSHMRELRVQHRGRPYRVLYAFDPRRIGILLLGGDKTGNDRWYDIFVPLADALYDVHLREMNQEDF